jgi:voltage-gated potassium channel
VHVAGRRAWPAAPVGYTLIEGWNVWDAFYMTVTDGGHGRLRRNTSVVTAGRMFTVVLIFSGVGTAFYTATLVATIIVEGGLHRRLEQRRAARMLEHIKDHFIVCGYGRIGSIIAAELHQQGVPLAVIERDPERVRQAIDRGWLALEADASREEVLAKAGIHRARGLITAVGTDAENVFTVLTARVMRPDLFIIARVESDDAEHKLRRAGADRVISPYQIGATQMVQTALVPAVVEFFHLATSSERLDLSMEQVHIKDDSPLANQTIVDAGIRQKFGVIVVGIKRAGGGMDFNPPPDAIMRSGDELVVLGRTESVKALEKGVVA